MTKQYPQLRYSKLLEQGPVAFSRWRRRLLIYLLCCFIVTGIVMLFDTDSIWSGDWWFGVVATFILSMIVVGYIPPVRRRISLLACYAPLSQAFAAENGFTYTHLRRPSYGLFRPSIEHTGFLSREQQVIGGQYGEYPVAIYVHTARHPWTSRFSRIATRVYQITLPKRLPHIYLASLTASGTAFRTNTLKHFDDDQRVTLEGNFSKHFIVYSHRRNRTEALSILAPNVMSTILDTNRNFNVEIIGDQLFLYSPDYLWTDEEARKGFDALEAILKQLDHTLKSFKLVLPNDAKFPFLRARAGFGTSVIAGRYVNASLLFIGWVAMVQSVRIAISHVAVRTKIIEYVVLFGVTAALFAGLLIYRRKNKSSLRAQ